MKKLLIVVLILMLTLSAAQAESGERRYDNGVYQQTLSLYDLGCFSKDQFHLVSDSPHTDNYGGKYSSELYACDGSADFFLGGQYAELSGTLFVTERATTTSAYVHDHLWELATFNVYCDDQLIYSFKGLDARFQPKPLLFDVRGVQFLRIEFKSNTFIDTGMTSPLAKFGNAELTPLA